MSLKMHETQYGLSLQNKILKRLIFIWLCSKSNKPCCGRSTAYVLQYLVLNFQLYLSNDVEMVTF